MLYVLLLVCFVMFDLVFQYLAKRLAAKNVCEMTYVFCVGWDVQP